MTSARISLSSTPCRLQIEKKIYIKMLGMWHAPLHVINYESQNILTFFFLNLPRVLSYYWMHLVMQTYRAPSTPLFHPTSSSTLGVSMACPPASFHWSFTDVTRPLFPVHHHCSCFCWLATILVKRIFADSHAWMLRSSSQKNWPLGKAFQRHSTS